MVFFLSILPIGLLIYFMVKRNSLPSYIALPLIALLTYFLQAFYFETDFTRLNANVIAGLIATQTPITIIFGAILFNRMMEVSGSTDILRKWLANINPNPVAQIMIIGWAFTFMIEGASGFGTPAAIAAPILMGLGFKPLQVAMLALVMNSVPVSFGAVGTPTWFGFGALGLSDDVVLELGQKSAFIHFVAAWIIPLFALRFLVTWKQIKQNLVFIYLSILSCTIPYFLLAQINYEFPALVGGAVGLLISIVSANKGLGIHQEGSLASSSENVTSQHVMKALFPTMMLIMILIVTRIHQLGIKQLLNDGTTWFSVSLGGLGEFGVSQALILSLNNILGQGINESYKTLYVPSLIPFIVTVIVSIIVFKLTSRQTQTIVSTTYHQTKKPFFALLGALVMVKLMLVGNDNYDAMVITIGKTFADVTGDKWIYFSSYLGAIGAFFSGSNTVSNLTFGGIQLSIAETTGMSIPLILALQSVGGAMGNMVCLNNIIAVCTVLNVSRQEGSILKRTVLPMFLYGVIAALVAVVIY
ncbi:LctP [Pasteurella multocida subsp. multocida OH4807]|nr:LctP [Pasteurella multocida subsp. multocida OH4807]